MKSETTAKPSLMRGKEVDPRLGTSPKIRFDLVASNRLHPIILGNRTVRFDPAEVEELAKNGLPGLRRAHPNLRHQNPASEPGAPEPPPVVRRGRPRKRIEAAAPHPAE